MTTIISEPISLRTTFGTFQAHHLPSQSGQQPGQQTMEGIAISSVKHSDVLAPIVVRLQSSCLFSESFSAIDCDCALQLSYALELISKREGLIIYYYEEARGMGLGFKVRAIRLQQLHDLDSAAAYSALNIYADARTYAGAAEVIRFLGGKRDVVLLSNNPAKEKSLRDQGIRVVERQRVLCGIDNPEIVKYLKSKGRLFGHDIPDL